MIHESAFFYLCLNQPENALNRYKVIFENYKAFKDVIIPNSYRHYLEAMNRLGRYDEVVEFARSFMHNRDVIQPIRPELNWALMKQGDFVGLREWIRFYEANDLWVDYFELAYAFNQLYPDSDTILFEIETREQLSWRSTLGKTGIWISGLNNFSSRAFALYILKEFDQAEELMTGYTEEDYADFKDTWWSREVLLPETEQVWIEAFLGTIYARQGNKDLAKKQAEKLESYRSRFPFIIARKSRGFIPYLEARIYAVLGEKETAVSLLKESVQEGRLCESGSFLNDWDLVTLHDYEPFIELVNFE